MRPGFRIRKRLPAPSTCLQSYVYFLYKIAWCCKPYVLSFRANPAAFPLRAGRAAGGGQRGRRPAPVPSGWCGFQFPAGVCPGAQGSAAGNRRRAGCAAGVRRGNPCRNRLRDKAAGTPPRGLARCCRGRMRNSAAGMRQGPAPISRPERPLRDCNKKKP